MASFASTIFQFLGLATYNATPQTFANGSSNALQSDANAYLCVRQIVKGPIGGTTFDSPGLLNSRPVKVTAASLYSVRFRNTSAGTRYLMLFDSASVPANGATPKFIYALAAGSTLATDVFHQPWITTNGLVWASSTTDGTLTLDAGAATIWANIEYT